MTQDKSSVSKQAWEVVRVRKWRRAAASASGSALFGLMLVCANAVDAQSGKPQSDRAQSDKVQSSAPAVVAQLFNRPPSNVPVDRTDDAAQPAQAEPGDAGLLIRIDHLENQIRALNGQIEQLQFQQRRLEDVLRKVQQDTDFRFQEIQGRGGLAPAAPQTSSVRQPLQNPPPPSAPVTGAAGVTAPFAGPVGVPTKRGDAFDPSAQPDAPGAPRPLGSGPGAAAPSTASGGILLEDNDPNAPMDLMHPGRPRTAAIADPIQPDAVPSPPRSAGSATTSVSTPTAGRDEFELGRGLFRQGQYEAAQNAFSTFLQKSPKDARVPDATYWLGETYSQRGRHREAAEQYLKLSTDYPKSPRAPDGLLRLGMSLSALGAKEQACATFQEIGRKYPTASAGIKTSVDREFKRSKC
jgi:tol-pal system protein YbgF